MMRIKYQDYFHVSDALNQFQSTCIVASSTYSIGHRFIFLLFFELKFFFSVIIRCFWPICGENCSGLSDSNMHGVECWILSLHRGPSQKADIKALCNFYRSDVLLTLRCLLLQWKHPDRWTKVNQLESHDQQRLGTRYHK